MGSAAQQIPVAIIRNIAAAADLSDTIKIHLSDCRTANNRSLASISSCTRQRRSSTDLASFKESLLGEFAHMKVNRLTE